MGKNQDNILLSIIIPVYNTEFMYLKKLANIFVGNSDSRFEIIFVDDGSNEDTKKSLALIRSRISSMCYVFSQKNGGQNSARMTGISHAHGKYLLFADSDDYIDWHALYKILNFLETTDADLVPFNCKIVNKNYKTINRLLLANKAEKNFEEYKKYCLINCSSLWQQCIKKEFYEKVGFGLFSDAKIGEDLASIFPLYVLASDIQPIGVFLYSYVQRESSIMHSASLDQHLEILNVFRHIMTVLGDNLTKYESEFEWLAIWHLLYLEPRFLITESKNCIGICRLMREWVKNTFGDWENNIYYNKEKRFGVLLLIHGHYYFYASLHRIKNFLFR